MSFSIKIINNDTGGVIFDEQDSSCIICAVVVNDGVQGMVYSSCNADILASTVKTVSKVTDKIVREHSEIRKILMLDSLFGS